MQNGLQDMYEIATPYMKQDNEWLNILKVYLFLLTIYLHNSAYRMLSISSLIIHLLQVTVKIGYIVFL